MVAQPLRSLGPLYTAAVKLKGSPRISHFKAQIGRAFFRLERHPGLDVDLSGRIGMGALLCYALRLHALAEDCSSAATIVSTSPLYSSGEDVFATWFERPALPAGWKPYSVLATEWLLHGAAPPAVTLDRAQQLFQRYFIPRPALAECVQDQFDLSVHFRGTDKALESGRVPAAPMLEAANRHLPNRGAGRRVFLATDDPTFASEFRRAFSNAAIISYDLGTVAPGTPRHFSTLPAGDRAREALANIVLLGNAPLCLRTASYLSAMARIANPALRTVTINPVAGFPETQIAQAEALDK